MKKYSYRMSFEGQTIESASPYADSTHHIEIQGALGDEPLARRICEWLKMVFIEGALIDGTFHFSAHCTPDTSSFLWAGGNPQTTL